MYVALRDKIACTFVTNFLFSRRYCKNVYYTLLCVTYSTHKTERVVDEEIQRT